MKNIISMLMAMLLVVFISTYVVSTILLFLQARDNNIRHEIIPSDCIISDRGCGVDGYMDWPGTSEKRVDLQVHEMVDVISSSIDRYPVRFEKGK